MKTEIEQLKKELKAFIDISNEGLISFEKRIADLENQEAESDVIKIGDNYYTSFGHELKWTNEKGDNHRLAHGQLFRTKEAYEKWSKWTQIDVRVKNAIREGEKMFEADDSINQICFMWADFDLCSRVKSVKGTHLIEANSKKALEHVIKVVGKVDLKWYFENRI